MIKQYIKQAWEMLRQNKLFSTIYIFGTALGITMVMFLAIYIYSITGSVYPETDRPRTYQVARIEITPKNTTEHSNSSSLLSWRFVKECFYPLETPEVVTAIHYEFMKSVPISRIGSKQSKQIIGLHVDPNFWRMFDFDFLDGHPFSQADFDAGAKVAVITDLTAEYLFPDGNAVGRQFIYGGERYTVSGVVYEPSYLASASYGNVYFPYTVSSTYQDSFSDGNVLGSMLVLMKLKSQRDAARLRTEIDENIKRYQDGIDQNINLFGQPDDALKGSLRWESMRASPTTFLLKIGLVMGLFLLVPAINLAGLNSSRMEKRLSEMGVRKAFGAPRHVLMCQVLVENFLLTLLGAGVGLLLSYALAYMVEDMLVGNLVKFLSGNIDLGSSARGLTPGFLINFPIFFSAVGAALIINILSATIPAYNFTRRNITDALHGNLKK